MPMSEFISMVQTLSQQDGKRLSGDVSAVVQDQAGKGGAANQVRLSRPLCLPTTRENGHMLDLVSYLPPLPIDRVDRVVRVFLVLFCMGG